MVRSIGFNPITSICSICKGCCISIALIDEVKDTNRHECYILNHRIFRVWNPLSTISLIAIVPVTRNFWVIDPVPMYGAISLNPHTTSTISIRSPESRRLIYGMVDTYWSYWTIPYVGVFCCGDPLSLNTIVDIIPCSSEHCAFIILPGADIRVIA